jgi:hypothetical protein
MSSEKACKLKVIIFSIALFLVPVFVFLQTSDARTKRYEEALLKCWHEDYRYNESQSIRNCVLLGLSNQLQPAIANTPCRSAIW